MIIMSCIIKSSERGGHWIFEFADKSEFVDIKNPAWALRIAGAVSKDAYITTGMRPDGEWDIQAVNIWKAGKSETKARELALRIYSNAKKGDISQRCKTELKRGK